MSIDVVRNAIRINAALHNLKLALRKEYQEVFKEAFEDTLREEGKRLERHAQQPELN